METLKINIHYTNYRNEDKEITIIPKSLRFGTSEYHPTKQWLLLALELERNVIREYTVKDISYYDIPDLQMNGPNIENRLMKILTRHLE